jgi:hypothetical protein
MATIEFAETSAYKQKTDTIIKELSVGAQSSGSGMSTIRDYLFNLYVKLFDKVPNYINLSYYDYFCNAELEKKERDERFSIDVETFDANSIIQKEDGTITTFKDDIAEQQTYKKFIESYDGEDIAVYRYDEYPVIVIGKYECIIFYFDNGIAVYSPTTKLPQYVIDNTVMYSEDDEKNRYFSYVVYGQRGFNTTELPIKKYDIDLETNYNDDLPHEAIVDWIKTGKSGICILNGQPGTGKTHYIRNLMWECPDTEFMILNASCFDAINDSSFVEMILDNKNSVVILEDCEDLLTDRMGNNSRIGTLLNISEGILGDALKLRFICTFNASINKIDSAVIRKGRTHVKYEFKALTYDKAQKLAEKLNVTLPEKKNAQQLGYTLAEIYNADNNLVDDNTAKQLGFKR